MNFNVTLLGKVLYVTPWMVYHTHSDSDSKLALNEFEEQYSFKQPVKPEVDEENDEIIEHHVPKMSIGGVDEDNFTRVFPSYMTIVGLVGAGVAAKYGYCNREGLVAGLKGLRFWGRSAS